MISEKQRRILTDLLSKHYLHNTAQLIGFPPKNSSVSEMQFIINSILIDDGHTDEAKDRKALLNKAANEVESLIGNLPPTRKQFFKVMDKIRNM